MRQPYAPINVQLTKARRILLLGARAPVTLALARNFARVGHKVWVADSFRPHICERSSVVSGVFDLPSPRFQLQKFFARLEQIVLLERLDWVIPTCEEVLYVAPGAQNSALKAHFFVDTLKVLERLHHKGKFIKLCQEIGLSAPESHTLENRAQLKKFCSSASGKWIFKPVYSRFAARVQVWDERSKISDLERPVFPLLAQRFLEGEEFCTYGVARAGRLLAHVAYRPKYRAGRGAGVYFESLEDADSLEFVRVVVQHLNFTGQIAFDFVRNPSGLWPLECNPRAVSGAALFGPELATAWLEDGALLTVPAGKKAMFALPTLLYGLGKVPLFDLARDVLSAKELVWDASDPAPFWHGFECLRAMHTLARNLGKSAIQASTWDLEWDGFGGETHV